jgi:hypothetical protein
MGHDVVHRRGLRDSALLPTLAILGLRRVWWAITTQRVGREVLPGNALVSSVVASN